MKQTLNVSQFRDAFLRSSERKEQFSYEALGALFEYYEEADPDMELDVVAICCEWTEYADLDAFRADYGDEYETMRDIEDATTVIRLTGEAFLIVQF